MPLEAQAAAPDASSTAQPTTSQDAFSQALAASQAASSSPETTSQGSAATPPSPAPAQQATPANPLDVFKQHGFQVDQFKTPEDFAKALASERQQQARLAQLGQQVAPHYQQFSSWLQEQTSRAGQQQPAAQPTSEDPNAWLKEHFGKQWKVPSFDPSWQQAIKQGLLVIDDETGRYVPAPGAELAVAPMIGPANAFRDAHAEQMQELFLGGNPFQQFYEAMKPAFERDFQEMARNLIGEQHQQVTTQGEMEKWEQDHFSILYTTDTAGNQVETPAGKALFDEAEALMKNGFKDPLKAIELATKLSGFDKAVEAAKAEASKTPTQKSGEKIQSFIEKAQANGSGTHSFNQATPQAPVTVDQSELDNFFIQELRRSMASGA